MLENYPSLLVTKLYAPRLRSAHVARRSLIAALDAGLERKLILIAAAAGFGKTTLVADWSSQQTNRAAWFSLDEGDNDPIRFLSYLTAAVQVFQAQIGGELLAALQSPQPPTIDNALHSFINQLATLSNRLILILDDYHVIENPDIHAIVTFLLEHLPAQMTLVLLTRTDPPLPLARLRAKNELLELRAAELRFSVEEAEHFLNQVMHIGIPHDLIAALDTRTEGWIAGLQLAAVAMQGIQDDKTAFVQHFTGSHRFVLDYLIEEVLTRQPESVRRFLLQTSILHRMNGVLCSVVVSVDDGQATLEYLERNNLFLIPLDQSRYWYRYHHLFADLLQARLQAEFPGELRELRQRAAKWHEQNGLPEESVLYALAAEDFDYAASLITGAAAGVTRRGEVTTLLEWYRAFPPHFVEHYPSLGLQFGLAFALNGRWDEAEKLLESVEQSVNDNFRPDEILLLSYLVASNGKDKARLEHIAAEAAANVGRDPTTKMVLALVFSLKGDLRYACQLLAEAQATGEREGDISLALTALFHQCRFHVYLGNLHQAYQLCQGALERIHALGGAVLPMATFAHSALGRILIEWNELDKANEHLSEAIRLGERSGFVTGIISSSTIMLAEVKQAHGDSDGANRTAAEAITLAERFDPVVEVTWLKTYQARIWLAQGDTAADWMRDIQDKTLPASLFYPGDIAVVTQARVLLARRKYNEAIHLLTKMTAEAPNLLTVESLATLALARQAHGDSVNALVTLEQALTLAEVENRIRAFLDFGMPMARLLARFCESHTDHTYAQKVLAAFPKAKPAVEPLGERELAVLRLIVAGQSNDEIAQALTLALSTVKWYINELYGKLHVKTRAQAIARAYELKLLD